MFKKKLLSDLHLPAFNKSNETVYSRQLETLLKQRRFIVPRNTIPTDQQKRRYS